MAPHVPKKDMPSMERLLPLTTDHAESQEDKNERLIQRLRAAGKKL